MPEFRGKELNPSKLSLIRIIVLASVSLALAPLVKTLLITFGVWILIINTIPFIGSFTLLLPFLLVFWVLRQIDERL